MITIGVDIGQKHEPAAAAVVERDDRRASPDRTEHHYLVRHLERLSSGTCPEVARWLARVAARAHSRAEHGPTIYVDLTGLGQPVLDLLRDEGVPSPLYGVHFTHGDRRTRERRPDHPRQGLPRHAPPDAAPVGADSPGAHRRGGGARHRATRLRDRSRRGRQRAIRRLPSGCYSPSICVDATGVGQPLVTALGLAVQAGPVVSRVIQLH